MHASLLSACALVLLSVYYFSFSLSFLSLSLFLCRAITMPLVLSVCALLFFCLCVLFSSSVCLSHSLILFLSFSTLPRTLNLFQPCLPLSLSLALFLTLSHSLSLSLSLSLQSFWKALCLFMPGWLVALSWLILSLFSVQEWWLSFIFYLRLIFCLIKVSKIVKSFITIKFCLSAAVINNYWWKVKLLRHKLQKCKGLWTIQH